MGNINAIVPQATVHHATDTTSARLTATDHLHSVCFTLYVASLAEEHEEVGHQTKVRMTIDHDQLESFVESLSEMVDRRKARIAALPVYIARYIDDPAFPTQRLGVDCEYQSALVETVGTMSELVQDWEFTGMTNDRDSDGRPKYFVRRKI